MDKRLRIIVLVAVVLSLLLLTSTALAKRKPQLPLDVTGELNGAAFVIHVPENWNGTLLVYAHGYGGDQVIAPDAAPLSLEGSVEDLLLSHGYALAASGFRNAGWNVEEGIKDTQRLVLYFKENVAHPNRVILYGVSMGTAIVLKSVEMYEGLYDGAVPICSVAMGASRNADFKLDFTVSYAAAFGWDENWGTIGDLREDLDVFSDVIPGLLTRLGDPSNTALFEFMRLVNDMPPGGFYGDNGALPPGVVVNTTLAFYMRQELAERAGGPVAQNADHVDSLSEEDRVTLRAQDMTDEEMEALLSEMNAMANIEARRSARTYLERYADFSGRIKAPILMLHNIQDPMALVEGATAYADSVAAQGNADLLMRVYTDRIGHCNVTPNQVLTLMEAMDTWLDTGARPQPSAFPSEDEFNVSFEPGPWPQPPTE